MEALATALKATAGEIRGDDDADSLFDFNSARGELKGLAGVDFEVIVEAAESQAEIIWDLIVPAISELVHAQVGLHVRHGFTAARRA